MVAPPKALPFGERSAKRREGFQKIPPLSPYGDISPIGGDFRLFFHFAIIIFRQVLKSPGGKPVGGFASSLCADRESKGVDKGVCNPRRHAPAGASAPAPYGNFHASRRPRVSRRYADFLIGKVSGRTRRQFIRINPRRRLPEKRQRNSKSFRHFRRGRL